MIESLFETAPFCEKQKTALFCTLSFFNPKKNHSKYRKKYGNVYSKKHSKNYNELRRESETKNADKFSEEDKIRVRVPIPQTQLTKI